MSRDTGAHGPDVARDLGISERVVSTWWRQEPIDQGLAPGPSTAERAEPVAAKRRICELEAELVLRRRAAELLKTQADPNRGSPPWPLMAAEGRCVQVACRVLGVSDSGYTASRKWGPPPRTIRHA